MCRTCFHNMHHPIARSLERVGTWCSILIPRDELHGYRRCDACEIAAANDAMVPGRVATARIHRRSARRKAAASAA
jgi:hypothetical protein